MSPHNGEREQKHKRLKPNPKANHPTPNLQEQLSAALSDSKWHLLYLLCCSISVMQKNYYPEKCDPKQICLCHTHFSAKEENYTKLHSLVTFAVAGLS